MSLSFLSTLSAQSRKRTGLKRRAGVAAPLFSLYSAASVGIGELPDLKFFVDWCRKTGMSLLQLLPMNDVGFDFRPYDAQSTFALEPMYLSLAKLSEVQVKPFQAELERLRKRFPTGQGRVDYEIKAAKLDLLWKIFQSACLPESPDFTRYRQKNKFWLRDYSFFKVLKEENQQKNWEAWPEEFKQRKPETLQTFTEENADRIKFHEWLQWQLARQFEQTKKYAGTQGVFLVGDLPFLVSHDSADVWSHQDYFKLDLAAGAPPDWYLSKGQRWGMPPYRWEKIEENRYKYLFEKLRYAENFYDLLRIDHVVGMFRLWSIPLSEPLEQGGLKGHFDPEDESVWEEHGRKWLSVILANTHMLLCGEDLGVIPPCTFKVLEELGIPGMDVQRWTKDWGKTYDFKTPETYRKNSIAVLSTHDMSPFLAWWEFEAGTVEEAFFARKCGELNLDFENLKSQLFDLEKSFHGRLRWRREIHSVEVLLAALKLSEKDAAVLIDLYLGSYDEKTKFWRYLGLEGNAEEKTSPHLVEKVLRKAADAASIFNIHLLQDWLSIHPALIGNSWDFRINFPGVTSDKNWSLVMPFSLEEMLQLPINEKIKDINQQAGRI